jgi:hypothetical protein
MHFSALLAGFYEGKNLKFAAESGPQGRVFESFDRKNHLYVAIGGEK